MSDSMAIQEMYRLRNASAWSPLARVSHRRRNQWSTRYTFADGSQMTVYLNGDAAWHPEDNGTQRWRNWHHCNAQGR